MADRLHNMRTLKMAGNLNKQKKTASETRFLYAPLAHRLGLHRVKSELEDLSMKYLEKGIYQEIADKLNEKKFERNAFVDQFSKPIIAAIKKENIKARVYGRPKNHLFHLEEDDNQKYRVR